MAPAVEAATHHREQFSTWRERPSEFNFDGRYPLLEVFDRAAEAWKGDMSTKPVRVESVQYKTKACLWRISMPCTCLLALLSDSTATMQ